MPDPMPFTPPLARLDYDEDDGRDESGVRTDLRVDGPREPTRVLMDVDRVTVPDLTTFCHP